MNLEELSASVWENKRRKGYNLSDVPLEFGMLTEKVGASFTAWRRDQARLGEELADVVLYAASISKMAGLDLAAEIQTKIAKNNARND